MTIQGVTEPAQGKRPTPKVDKCLQINTIIDEEMENETDMTDEIYNKIKNKALKIPFPFTPKS